MTPLTPLTPLTPQDEIVDLAAFLEGGLAKRLIDAKVPACLRDGWRQS